MVDNSLINTRVSYQEGMVDNLLINTRFSYQEGMVHNTLINTRFSYQEGRVDKSLISLTPPPFYSTWISNVISHVFFVFREFS